VSDPLLAYVQWFLSQPEAIRFDAHAEPTRSAVVIPFRPHALWFSSQIEEADGAALFRHAWAMGLEGIVSKRIDTRTGPGRVGIGARSKSYAPAASAPTPAPSKALPRSSFSLARHTGLGMRREKPRSVPCRAGLSRRVGTTR